MKKQIFIFLLVTTFITGVAFPGFSLQENTEITTRLRMEYFNSSGSKNIECTLLAKINKKYSPLNHAEIYFYRLADTVNELIGVTMTNEDGKASLYLNTESGPEIQIGGGVKFLAEFRGFDNYKSSSTEKSIVDVEMQIEFSKKNESKMIILNLSKFDEDGRTVPVDEVPVIFYVPRTFSLLEFGEGQLSNGSVSIDFPTDIPGDTAGFITIVAKIDDHDEFGTIQASNGINWGKPVQPDKAVKRGLGDTNAPLWMVYTLIVLLSLVWFHYLYAIFTIYRIKREGDKVDLPEKQTY